MGKKINITGQTFNDLTAIEPTSLRSKNGSIIWRFRCKCGNETLRVATDVVRGLIRCCEKCCKQNVFQNNRYQRPINIRKIGEKSGHLEICDIEINGESSRDIVYICKCDCGNPKQIKISHTRFLIKTQAHSCGCERAKIAIANGKCAIRKTNITNMRQGKLVAVKCLDNEMKATSLWELKCDCGNIHILAACDFERGRAYSCGCISSKGEQKIEQYFKEHNIIYKKQVSFPDLIGINNGLLRFDFGIYSQANELICLIEFDGYHHHYETDMQYKGVDVHKYTVEHDTRKNEYCEKNNIILHRLNNQKTIDEDLHNILSQ